MNNAQTYDAEIKILANKWRRIRNIAQNILTKKYKPKTQHRKKLTTVPSLGEKIGKEELN